MQAAQAPMPQIPEDDTHYWNHLADAADVLLVLPGAGDCSECQERHRNALVALVGSERARILFEQLRAGG